mgnify:CR=1 FL=1
MHHLPEGAEVAGRERHFLYIPRHQNGKSYLQLAAAIATASIEIKIALIFILQNIKLINKKGTADI